MKKKSNNTDIIDKFIIMASQELTDKLNEIKNKLVEHLPPDEVTTIYIMSCAALSANALAHTLLHAPTQDKMRCIDSFLAILKGATYTILKITSTTEQS